ncbi:RNA polymerase sigma-70 factor (ECF subfamily) [Asanoa ferruginea]|uniref:RNA polymerase sigma-70 factor (ECF subfamily) n=1 Tax=Asanoa ferruginea TaxID=53367 RepID=A0A3D9ZTL7_9ACTN|nr:RNA polymerase subunit sigma-70 [Asanoa ferruginea]REF99802.1 RNA polymerase sigma-70 factor (ECF subfamily) [Asanoa ferruginea]GIF51820.1 RNA polymerase sigma factor [Asanoa ferruginea]
MEAGEFAAVAEPLRRELTAHCYRMLGSADEAQDVVQDTYLRAWRGWGRFEGRSSVRVWLYRIATNACLTALGQRARRPLPSGLGAPADDADTPSVLDPEVPWLQPLPDDPADTVVGRETLRLALVASLQLLPPRQRAVLLLREVLEFSAAEVASLLDTSVPAVKSSLQRARATLDAARGEPLSDPDSPQARAQLDAYMSAFVNSDLTALEEALRKDATLEVVPSRTWFAGKATCVPYLASVLGYRGEWAMFPVGGNGQPAVVVYRAGAAFGVVLLAPTPTGLAGIVLFIGADHVDRFGYPPVLRPTPASPAR